MAEIERYDVSEEWAHSGIIKAGDLCFLGYCVGNIGGTIEEQIKTKLLQASKLIRDAYDMTDGIVTREVPKAESQKIRQKKESKYTALVPHEVIVDRHEEPTYNLKCRNYGEIRYKDGKVERTCIVGMDMCYCSVKCAYATNNVCSLKG